MVGINVDRPDGADKVARRLHAAADDVAELADTVAADGAEMVRQQTQIEAPKRTGALSRGAMVDRVGAGEYRVGVGRLKYANPVHSGVSARGIAANPYLHRAANKVADRVRTLAEVEAADIVRRANR